jgi:hypothetical protein
MYSSFLYAQTDDLDWVNIYPGHTSIENIVPISSSEIIVSGIFDEYYGVDLDPSDEENIFSSKTGHHEVFIQKYSINNELRWTKVIHGDGHKTITKILVDKNEDIYILGSFNRETDFNPDIEEEYLVTSNALNDDINSLFASDFYLLKLDSNGFFLWVKTFGGIYDDFAFDMSFDSNNDILITGSFSDNIVFNYNGVSKMIESVGGQDIYILKLSNSGDFIWVRRFGSTEVIEQSKNIVIDIDDNIYISGMFGACIDFDPSPINTHYECSDGRFDAFVLKLNKDGLFEWVFTYGNGSWDQAPCLEIYDNNIYIVGHALGRLEIDDNSGSIIEVGQSGDWHVLVLKLALDKEIIWISATKNHEEYTQIRTNDIDFDTNGNLIVVGKYFGTLGSQSNDDTYLSNDTGDTIYNQSNWWDMFYLKMNSEDGNIFSITPFNSYHHDEIICIKVIDDNIFLGGKFTSIMDFDPTSNLVVREGNAGFLLKLKQNKDVSLQNTDNIFLYPNPTKNKVNIQLDKVYSSVNTTIYSINGMKLYSTFIGQTNQVSLDLSLYSDGVYVIQIEADGYKKTKKIIKF